MDDQRRCQFCGFYYTPPELPRVPSQAEMHDLMMLARQRLADGQLWINPDCGLKTRGWPEVKTALENMVAAAQEVRKAAKQGQP